MGTYEVSVEHSFQAGHAIRLGDGTWEETHWHLWQATASFRAAQLQAGTDVVVDFLEAMRALKLAAAEMEGRDLNRLPAFAGMSVSAERVAEHLARRLRESMGAEGARLYSVSVTEAPQCRAAYYPS